MTHRRASTGFLIGVVTFVFVGLICCGGGGLALAVLAVTKGPEMAVELVLQPDPLPVQTIEWDEARVEILVDKIEHQLTTSRTIRLTPEELTQLVLHQAPDSLEVFRIDVDDEDRAVLDLSFRPDDTDPRFINVHLVGDVELEDAWFTTMTIDELQLGDIALGSALYGQEMAADINRNLAQQRLSDPDLARLMDSVEWLAVEDGGFTLTLTEDAAAEIVDGMRADAAQPVQEEGTDEP